MTVPLKVANLIGNVPKIVQKESYIEANLTKRLSDIVYSVNTFIKSGILSFICVFKNISRNNLRLTLYIYYYSMR